MRRRGSLIMMFFVCVFICIFLIFFSQKNLLQGINGALEELFLPFQRMVYGLSIRTPDEVTRLRIENAALSAQLAKEKDVLKENQALHDQFATTSLLTKHLLPATVIGSPSFIPGISQIDSFIINKGTAEGVKEGDIVVYKDNLVGKIDQTMPHESKVILPTSSAISFAAVTSKTGALGVLRGEGAENMTLGNVVLSDFLNKGDLVITKGDIDLHDGGYPSGLVVGKIVAVSKRNSALFQTADVLSLLQFEKLSTVFVETNY